MKWLLLALLCLGCQPGDLALCARMAACGLPSPYCVIETPQFRREEGQPCISCLTHMGCDEWSKAADGYPHSCSTVCR